MKRIVLLTCVVLGCAAGTASAQTSVRLSIGFEVPSPHLSGYVLIGRPHLRPVYRPSSHSWGHRRILIVTPRVYRAPARVIVVEARHGDRRHRRQEWREGRDRH
jgi:hypothetical protein